MNSKLADEIANLKSADVEGRNLSTLLELPKPPEVTSLG
jgi:hypothetical protein